MKKTISILCLLFLAGCATTGPPIPGTRLWHEERLVEIEVAYERGEIAIEDYLTLKNDADRIRAEHRAALQAGRIRPSYVGVFSVHHRHHH